MSEDSIADQIDALAKQKLANRLGVRKELKRLPDQLEHGEELVTMASGNFEDGNGLVVVTNRRLIYSEQGSFKNKVEEFTFDRVASIGTEKKMMSGRLKLAVSGGGSYEIKNVMPKDRVDEIAAYVRQRIGGGGKPAPPTSDVALSAPKSEQVDVGARLAKLAELKEQGLITDEEFAAKRAALLEGL